VQPARPITEKAIALSATESDKRLLELTAEVIRLETLKQIMIDQQGGKQNTQMNERKLERLARQFI
jgi:hypothetical protein